MVTTLVVPFKVSVRRASSTHNSSTVETGSPSLGPAFHASFRRPGHHCQNPARRYVSVLCHGFPYPRRDAICFSSFAARAQRLLVGLAAKPRHRSGGSPVRSGLLEGTILQKKRSRVGMLHIIVYAFPHHILIGDLFLPLGIPIFVSLAQFFRGLVVDGHDGKNAFGSMGCEGRRARLNFTPSSAIFLIIFATPQWKP